MPVEWPPADESEKPHAIRCYGSPPANVYILTTEAAAISRVLRNLSPSERLSVIHELRRVYCPNCWRKHSDTNSNGERCPCIGT